MKSLEDNQMNKLITISDQKVSRNNGKRNTMFIDTSSYGKLEMLLQQSSANNVVTGDKKADPSIKSSEES